MTAKDIDFSKISTRSLMRGALIISVGTLLLALYAITWFDHRALDIRVSGRESVAKVMAEGLAIAIQDDVISENYAQIESRLRQALSDPQVLSAMVADEDGKVLSLLELDPKTGQVKPVYGSTLIEAPTQSSTSKTEGEITTQWLRLEAGTPIGWLRLKLIGSKVDDALIQLSRQVAQWLLAACAILLGALAIVLWRTQGLIRIEEAFLKEKTDALEMVANHDHLTKLPNRYLLLDRLGQAIASSHRNRTNFALCFIDLDGFKPVNDAYGHDAGDYVLKEVASRLTDCVRENDTVARIGGDEFVLILVDIEVINGIHITLERILEAIKKPIALPEEADIAISLSMGVTVFPEDSSSPEDLLNHADEAMYSAKKSGPGQYAFYQIEKSINT